jgi:hypothetical protein
MLASAGRRAVAGVRAAAGKWLDAGTAECLLEGRPVGRYATVVDRWPPTAPLWADRMPRGRSSDLKVALSATQDEVRGPQRASRR